MDVQTHVHIDTRERIEILLRVWSRNKAPPDRASFLAFVCIGRRWLVVRESA